MVKTIATGILLAMFSGLIATLWAFHADIVENKTNIKNTEYRLNSLKDDIHYIREKIDNIHGHLINRKN